jgi:hypothetical protein
MEVVFFRWTSEVVLTEYIALVPWGVFSGVQPVPVEINPVASPAGDIACVHVEDRWQPFDEDSIHACKEMGDMYGDRIRRVLEVVNPRDIGAVGLVYKFLVHAIQEYVPFVVAIRARSHPFHSMEVGFGFVVFIKRERNIIIDIIHERKKIVYCVGGHCGGLVQLSRSGSAESMKM